VLNKGSSFGKLSKKHETLFKNTTSFSHGTINSSKQNVLNGIKSEGDMGSQGSISSTAPKWYRTYSPESLMLKGMAYKFKLKDLPKYSQTLKESDLRCRFTKSALGKRLPWVDEKVREKQDMHKRMKHLQYLEMLKNEVLN